MTDRREFLRVFGAAAAAAVLDPERLLWVPGRKTIFLPSVLPELVAFDVVAYVNRHWAAFKHGGHGMMMHASMWRHYLTLMATEADGSKVITARHRIPTDADTREVISEINRRLGPQPPPFKPTVLAWDELTRSDEPLSLKDILRGIE